MNAHRYGSWFASLVVTAALLMASCAETPQEPASERPLSEAESLVTLDRPSAGPFDIERERSIKASELGPTARPASIDWQAASLHRRLDMTSLNDDQRLTLVDLPLPVLLPSGPDVLAHSQLTRGERWYAASASWDRHTVYVSGNATVRRLPSLVDDAPQTSNLSIIRSEGIVNLSFVDYGAAYTITVECESPLEDPRCTEDDYVVGLAESMALAGEVP